ncbi:hypothetical protein CAOG_02728 [Capsaspora owczarzaki ATCC 30864]|nr:hypothetical protein CAOG_02728 [Capsaspora owczarzaki ATCC 30864]KJE91612.1 hypothetical protein, variant [Capsaspora owczarzaki ATCC 30864]|eukprot:XP_004349478.2 hypothetical protein CAOG_02728 [Capsaspora owczarzaki ATCC 30864]
MAFIEAHVRSTIASRQASVSVVGTSTPSAQGQGLNFSRPDSNSVVGTDSSTASSQDLVLTEADIAYTVRDAMSRLLIARCNSSEQLIITLHALQMQLGGVLLESSVAGAPVPQVLVIDSVSAFYWMDRDSHLPSSQKGSPASSMSNFAAQPLEHKYVADVVKRLCQEHQLIVLATKPSYFASSLASSSARNSNSNSSSSSSSNNNNSRTSGFRDYMHRGWQLAVTHRLVTSNAVADNQGIHLLQSISAAGQVTNTFSIGYDAFGHQVCLS